MNDAETAQKIDALQEQVADLKADLFCLDQAFKHLLVTLAITWRGADIFEKTINEAIKPLPPHHKEKMQEYASWFQQVNKKPDGER